MLLCVSVSRLGHAGPLSIEPKLGLSTEYLTNPDLRPEDERAENHEALLLNLPISYVGDTFRADLVPSGRYSDARGYSSLSSDFLRLDADLQYMSELGSLGVTAGAARESSLYNGGEGNRGVGVRRDTRSAGLDWKRSPSERIQLGLSGGWTRVIYDQPRGATNLVNYRYVSVGPSLRYATTERTFVVLSGGAGRYRSLDDVSSSKDYNLQLGFEHQLSELWTVSANAGYSRSSNEIKYFFGPFYLGTVKSTQNGSVYSFNVTRHGEHLSLDARISKALRPGGFAFLSRQQGADITLSYNRSERWWFAGHGGFNKITDPVRTGGETSRKYFSADCSANYRWSPDLTISLRAARVEQRFDFAAQDGKSSGISLEFTRQFLRRDL